MSKYLNIIQSLHQSFLLTLCNVTLFSILIGVSSYAQTPNHSINYCSLIEAAENYGRLSLQYKQEVPPNEVTFFNSQMAASFKMQSGSIPKIDQYEFQSASVFEYGKTASFPPTTGYHPSHTTPHNVFHIVKEVYRIQHHSPSCTSCIENSLDSLNLVLRGTSLWSDFNKSFRVSTSGVPIRQAEMLTFSTFLKCYYFDAAIYTHKIKNGKLGPTFITPTDTTFITCAAEIKVVEPNYTRNCNMPTKMTFLGTSLYRGTENCPGSAYRATHALNSPCGKDTMHQYFVIKNDGPTIACVPDMVVPCLSQIVVGSPTVTTSCALPHTLTTEGPKLISGQDKCNGSVYEIKYIAVDACNRRVECIQKITIEMESPLTITCDQDELVVCKDQIKPGNPIVISKCELEVTITHTGPTLINGRDNCPGAIYEIIYTAEDECGTIASCKQRFTIDNEGPKIECAENEIVECKYDIKGTDPKVETSCGQDYTITEGSITLESGQENCDGAVYSITYTVTEECGRSVECKQLFTLQNDPPFMLCPDDLTLECIEDLEDQYVDVKTSCNLESDDTNTDPELIAGKNNCPGAVYEIKYVATDECGRGAACKQLIKIQNDPPTITCPPNETVQSQNDIKEGKPEVTVSCNLKADATVSGPHLVSGDPDCPGAVFKLTYEVTDECGRTAECDQFFTVIGQDIIIDCPPDIVVKCKDDIYPHISNKVSSWLYGNTVEFTSGDPKPLGDDEDCPGNVYEVVHEYKLKCDSIIQCIQRFTIENEGPRIICPPDQVIESLQDTYDQNAEIDVDCNLPYDVEISQPELISGQLNQPGSEYYVTYTVTDECDRKDECQQKLTIIARPPGQREPCVCVDDWLGVSRDLTENRNSRFNQDIAFLLNKMTCEQLKKMKTDGITAIYSAWASNDVLGADYVFTNLIQERGPLDLTMRNLTTVNNHIKNVEAILYGDAKEIRKLIAPQLLKALAKSWGLGGLPATALTSIQNLGKFTEYLNKEILITNMKTLADIAKRDPNVFDIHHFMKEYVDIDGLKTTKEKDNLAKWRYRNMINEYVTFRLGSTTPLDVKDVWKSQANVNLYYSHAKAMLREICDLYCYRLQLKASLDRLKNEQAMLQRFKEVYDYFMSYDCQGVPKPDCGVKNATMVQNSDGTYICECTGNTKWDPNKEKCAPFVDCGAIANTSEVFENGEYTCDCIQSGYQWSPNGDKCVEYPSCSSDNMSVQWNSNFDVYECQCDAGFKLDPSFTYCAEYEDCSTIANSESKWDASNQSYDCECKSGYRWDPDESFCAAVEDCSTKANTNLEWDISTQSYVCSCATGYDLDPSGQNCVLKPECSIANATLKYNSALSAYECNCDKGYVFDQAGNCILDLPDCSPLVNAEPVWNSTYEVYECQCKNGFDLNPDRSKCVPKPPCQIANAELNYEASSTAYVCDCIAGYEMDAHGDCVAVIADCSHMSNSEAVWNTRFEVYECQCLPGFVFEAGDCIKEKPNCELKYANTEAVWNAQVQDYECKCKSGYTYDPGTGNCEVPMPDCSSYYRNTKPVWSSFKNDYECDCISGYVWNQARTGCVDPLAIAQASCRYANARVKYNKKKNEYKCECVKGYKWNKSRTGCEPKTGFMDALAGLAQVAGALNDGMNGGFPTGGNNNPQVLPQNEHQGQCSKQYGNGAAKPESYTFDMGFTFATVSFEYETYGAKDRIHVYQNGRKIHDSGCVGTDGWRKTSLQLSGGQVRVVVDPLCDPTDSQTAWKFVLGCPTN